LGRWPRLRAQDRLRHRLGRGGRRSPADPGRFRRRLLVHGGLLMADRRTALARVRGLGAAREGVGHWWSQRVSALLLIPLLLWFVARLVEHTGTDNAHFTPSRRQTATHG